MMINIIILMSDDALIKAQDNIIIFLMEGPKGRDDFWNDDRFKKSSSDVRGVYPRKILHMMQDAYILKKYYENKRIKWCIAEGAYFRLNDDEYEWSYVTPKVNGKEARITVFSDKESIRFKITYINEEEQTKTSVLKDYSTELLDEVEKDSFPYLTKVKEALKDKPKNNWLKKLKLW